LKTLVLLHGWGTYGQVWRRQVEVFGGGGEIVIGGGGKGAQPLSPSPEPPPPIPERELIEAGAGNLEFPAPATKPLSVLTPALPAWDREWLVNYLGNLTLEDTAVVGWSLGGMLLLEALAEMAGPPAALVLVAVSAVFCQHLGHPLGQPPAAVRALRRALVTDPRRVLRDFALDCLAPGEEVFQDEVATLFMPPETGADLARGLDYLLHQDLRPLLPRISGPLTIIQGDRDRIVPLNQAEFLHRHLPGASLVILPGAGHLPFWTQAAAFNQILDDIIKKSWGEGVRGCAP
jgi:pimeloyl-[acyl-carrier protein] methyl ester esterase